MSDTDQLSDLQIVARTMFGEARNQGNLGLQAVASVIMNRANHGGWWGSTPRDVCLKPYQFSCWNENDPNREVILGVDEDYDLFATCVAIAERAISGQLNDITGGADSYVVRGLVTNWNKNITPIASIGVHDFYKTV